MCIRDRSYDLMVIRLGDDVAHGLAQRVAHGVHIDILGAGGYGRTVADVAAQTGEYNEILFLDDSSVCLLYTSRCV